MENKTMFTISNDGKLELYKEPYATIECATEEDYNSLIKVVEDKWIPVSEKLPNEGDYVLVCFDDGFVTGVGYEEDWELWADSGEVVAWRLMPEPYQAE